MNTSNIKNNRMMNLLIFGGEKKVFKSIPNVIFNLLR